MKKRLSLAVAAGAMTAMMLTTVTAAAVKDETVCPPAASGFDRVSNDGWWDRTEDGFIAAGIPVYNTYRDRSSGYTDAFDDFAAAFGLGDGAGLEAFVRGEQWETIDRNDNGFGCMKSLPVTRGTPAYIFVGVDDRKPAGA